MKFILKLMSHINEAFHYSLGKMNKKTFHHLSLTPKLGIFSRLLVDCCRSALTFPMGSFQEVFGVSDGSDDWGFF